MRERTYRGSCHCGTVRYRLTTSIPPADWSVRACQCAFCRAHGAATTSDPEGAIEWSAEGADAVQRYRFALGTAGFLVCRRCGVYGGAVIETPLGRFGIVNVRLLSPRPDGLPDAEPVSYDGEDESGRIARRERRWTPVTAVPWDN